jgi:hypothetical protein
MDELETNEKELELCKSSVTGQIGQEYGTPYIDKERELFERMGDLGWRNPFVRTVLPEIVWCMETLALYRAAMLRHRGFRLVLEMQYGRLRVYLDHAGGEKEG